jgi:hypothetical protein
MARAALRGEGHVFTTKLALIAAAGVKGICEPTPFSPRDEHSA